MTELEKLIAEIRNLPTIRSNTIDGHESDGTPKYWRDRPFVSQIRLEELLAKRLTDDLQGARI